VRFLPRSRWRAGAPPGLSGGQRAKGREVYCNDGTLELDRDQLGAPLANEKRQDSEDDLGSHAADEPTAVWDANTLRQAGLGDLIKKPDSEPPPAATPAARGNQGPSIVVDEAAAGARAQRGPDMRQGQNGSGELGWGATLGLAAGLGAAVYLLIRFFK
jgi:hypothetical protein